MARLASSLDRIRINPGDITSENAGEYIGYLADYINNLVDIVSFAPADNIESAAVDSQSILQNSIDKKHVLATNSSNLLDNPSFELVGINNAFEVKNSGGSWSRFEPNLSADGFDPYQGRYVAKYDTVGQTTDASIFGSGDMGIVDTYNPGVIQAQQGEVYTFSFRGLYPSTPHGSDYDNVQGKIRFHGKDGAILSTATNKGFPTTATNTWHLIAVESAVAPAGTAYITAGVEVLRVAGETISYYIDATRLGLVSGGDVPTGGIYSASVAIPADQATTPSYTDQDTGTVSYQTEPVDWTEHVTVDWAEDGSTGHFKYTGTTTSKFLVTWSLTLDYATSASVYGQRTTIAGKIQRYNGSSWSDVLGSETESGERGQFTPTSFGFYWFMGHVSGSAIVSVNTNDELRFVYGFSNAYNTGFTDYTVTLRGIGSSNFRGVQKGASINIIPAEGIL